MAAVRAKPGEPDLLTRREPTKRSNFFFYKFNNCFLFKNFTKKGRNLDQETTITKNAAAEAKATNTGLVPENGPERERISVGKETGNLPEEEIGIAAIEIRIESAKEGISIRIRETTLLTKTETEKREKKNGKNETQEPRRSQ